jgi:tRNA/rRNA methyltransferase
MTGSVIGAINVVLVRPAFGGNVGAAARALANMGGDRLILVDPRCAIEEEARMGAAGAQKWLAEAQIHKSWEEFYAAEGRGFRVALTRRTGKRRLGKPLPETIADLRAQARPEDRGLPLYLVFGPEAHGLSADDMAWVNRAAALPVPGKFKSLNLAQAVLLALFVAKSEMEKPEKEQAKPENGPALFFPDRSIRRWLEAMGFSLERRRMSAYLTLRRLLLQNWPCDRELQVLDAILQQNIRKLEELKTLKAGLAAGGEPGSAASAALLEEIPDHLA